MGLIVDIIFGVMLVGFVIAGFRAGLVRTLAEFIGYIFAVIASIVLTGFVTDAICQFFLRTRPPTGAEYYFLRMIATVIIFVLLQTVVRMGASALDAIFRLPLLHMLNQLLGGVFGAFKGVIIIFLLCSLVQVAGPVFQTEDFRIDQQELFSTSFVFRTISSFNPVYYLFHVEDFLKESGISDFAGQLSSSVSVESVG